MKHNVNDLEQGERLIHDAVMDGILGMAWWETWVEDPPSAAWAEHLNSNKIDQCGCGQIVCMPAHGVRLVGGERYEEHRGRWTWCGCVVVSGSRSRTSNASDG